MADTYGAVEMRAALQRLRRGGGLPIAFGGLFEGTRQFRIAELAGTATHALLGLTITTGNGLGGKAMALSRPVCVSDYPASRVISHEYDAAVAEEGLRCVLAVPVVVRRRVRGVLYGALRQPMALGERTLSVAVEAARELEQALAVRDAAEEEAQRVVATAAHPREADPAAWEEVRAAHGELRALAQRVHDPVLRQELLTALGRLAAAPPGGPARSAPPARPSVDLSPREVDVLACVASGATNATTADRLGLRPETVKSYLRSSMRKLGAHTRLQAVVSARRAGVLP